MNAKMPLAAVSFLLLALPGLAEVMAQVSPRVEELRTAIGRVGSAPAPARASRRLSPVPSSVVVGMPTESASCIDGLVRDDGTFENGYAPATSALDGGFLMYFPGPFAMDTLEQVCLCWTRGGPNSEIDHTIVIYDDDGPSGQPGTLLSEMAAQATGIPSFPATPFYTYDVSGSMPAVPDGGFYLGVGGWDRTVATDVFLCGDENGPGGTPAYFTNDGAGWNPLGTMTNAPDYQALGVRADLTSSGGGGGGGGGGGTNCTPTATTLCLNNVRFEVEFVWRQDSQSALEAAQTVPFGSNDSGLFFFNNPNNWELLVKVVDACSFNDRFWVFFAGTTNVEFEVRVTDTESGTMRTYSNPLGNPASPVQDTDAFSTCP